MRVELIPDVYMTTQNIDFFTYIMWSLCFPVPSWYFLFDIAVPNMKWKGKNTIRLLQESNSNFNPRSRP